MNANDPVISQPITCKLSCKNRNSDQIIPENVEIFYNCLKLPFFGLKIRLLFTDLFRIRFRIRYVYFGSGSNPDPAKSFGFLRIRFRFRIWIRNTDRIFYIAHSGSKGPQLYLLVRKRNSVVNCRRIKAHIRSKFPCCASFGNAHSGTSCGLAHLCVYSIIPSPTEQREKKAITGLVYKVSLLIPS
jgi:hypothetical protein